MVFISKQIENKDKTWISLNFFYYVQIWELGFNETKPDQKKKQKNKKTKTKQKPLIEVQLVVNRGAKFLSLWWETKNENLGKPDADT